MSRTGVLAQFGFPILVNSCESAGDDSSAGIGPGSSSASGGISGTPFPQLQHQPARATQPGMQSTAVQIASQVILGRNIANILEALGGETAWDNSRSPAV